MIWRRCKTIRTASTKFPFLSPMYVDVTQTYQSAGVDAVLNHTEWLISEHTEWLNYQNDVIPSTLNDIIPSTLNDVIPSRMNDLIPSTLNDVIPSTMNDFIPSALNDLILSTLNSEVPVNRTNEFISRSFVSCIAVWNMLPLLDCDVRWICDYPVTLLLPRCSAYVVSPLF